RTRRSAKVNFHESGGAASDPAPVMPTESCLPRRNYRRPAALRPRRNRRPNFPGPPRVSAYPNSTDARPAQLRCREMRHLFIADIEVRGDALHVVMILEVFHQLEHLFGRVARNRNCILGNP